MQFSATSRETPICWRDSTRQSRTSLGVRRSHARNTPSSRANSLQTVRCRKCVFAALGSLGTHPVRPKHLRSCFLTYKRWRRDRHAIASVDVSMNNVRSAREILMSWYSTRLTSVQYSINAEDSLCRLMVPRKDILKWPFIMPAFHQFVTRRQFQGILTGNTTDIRTQFSGVPN